MEIATFGGGCFWCTEGVFKQIRGVTNVTSGYSGGQLEKPTYEKVSMGTTNHAEAIQIEFDPNEIKYEDILYIFFKTHDPTTLNQQGADVGTQYRSVIFYHNNDQKNTAESVRKKLQSDYKNPIVTEIVPYTKFYKAEDYHQNFYANNPDKAYCRLVIDPKIQKLRKDFAKFVKN